MTEVNDTEACIDLLKELIAIPSLSKEEDNTALLITSFLENRGVSVHRHLNNVWAFNKNYDEHKPTILLNSHHDTVPPNKSYTLNPYEPTEKQGKIFGLGSNDAGGPLVSLIAAFLYFFERKDLPFNVLLAATAEEEISGKNGVEAIINRLPPVDAAIVGEPTLMQMAVAERGLMVLDATARGIAGHAARNEGENALYKALQDIEWLRTFRFPKTSALLGDVKMSVTSIETDNKVHNIVPSTCRFVVDVRLNELYSMEDVLATISQHVKSEISPRSTRLKSTGISLDHPLVRSGEAMGRKAYGSPTTSDKALMPWPSLKMGPGDSARSHTADEFIFVDEIREGINLYIQLLNGINELPRFRPSGRQL